MKDGEMAKIRAGQTRARTATYTVSVASTDRRIT